jgi:hypothetical protein
MPLLRSSMSPLQGGVDTCIVVLLSAVLLLQLLICHTCMQAAT